MSTRNLNTITHPLVIVRKNTQQSYSITQAVGTAFYIRPNVIVTCWHCIEATLPANHFYALRVRLNPGEFNIAILTSIERDQFGTDMATATTEYVPTEYLNLSPDKIGIGEEVWTLAFPYTQTFLDENNKINFEISGRFLRGYVTRNFFYPHPQFGRSEVYELDMLAPPGTSGSPLMRKGSFDVVGVIFGTTDVSTVSEFASVEADGTRHPEIIRIASFGLAYDHDWTSRLKTSHTQNFSLKDLA